MRRLPGMRTLALLSLLGLNACSAEGLDAASSGWDRDASAGIGLADDPAQPFVPTELEESFRACLSEAPPPDSDLEPPVPPCPDEMVLVEGDHCPRVVQRCVEWVEDPRTNPFARCKVYEEPSVCKGEAAFMRFCIDRLEAAGPDGLPLADKSWTEAKQLCESEGKRLCQEREWLFACEGEEARPYPYGFHRDPDLCNFERTEGLVTQKGKLADHREPVTSNPHCLSPFGVQNMVGNIDEWVVLDVPHFSTKIPGKKMLSGLKGGWWGPLRNRCRPTTVDHDEIFHELQTGFRCCKDAE